MKRNIVLAAVVVAMLVVIVVAGCTPRVVEKSSESSSSEEWSISSDCTACHIDEANCLSEAHKSTACFTCHADAEALAKVHSGDYESKSLPLRLKQTQVTESQCLSCHDGYDELAQSTVDCTYCTDDNGKTINPHEAKALTESHQAGLTCISCHEQHTGTAIATSASMACINCHHQNVYECYTCHE